MAASDSQMAAGRRLAADIRAIRRKHGVDQKEVLDATRLADDVIEQLEENCLVDHPAFNRVYLRSLFGVYGEAIGVKRADMVAAIEEVFDGNYVGALARDYLGISSDESAEDDVRAAEPDPTSGAQDESVPDEPTPAAPVEDEESSAPVDEKGAQGEAEEAQPKDDLPEEASSTGMSNAESAHEGGSDDGWSPSRALPFGSFDQDTKESVWTGLAGRKSVLLPNMSGTALVVIAGIAFVSLLWFSITTVMDMRSGDDFEAVAQDSSATEDVFRPEPIVLPESLDVAIVAFTEALDPIRITADRDLRKPYWVELLDTHRVAITDRIRLEREADHTRVLVDGFLLPESWLTVGGPVEISRDRVQTWLDSLVTEGIAPQRELPAEVIVPEAE